MQPQSIYPRKRTEHLLAADYRRVIAGHRIRHGLVVAGVCGAVDEQEFRLGIPNHHVEFPHPTEQAIYVRPIQLGAASCHNHKGVLGVIDGVVNLLTALAGRYPTLELLRGPIGALRFVNNGASSGPNGLQRYCLREVREAAKKLLECHLLANHAVA